MRTPAFHRSTGLTFARPSAWRPIRGRAPGVWRPTVGDGSPAELLLPGFPGYEPYCPSAVADTSGSWRGPDLTQARSIVDASGTKGMAVNVVGLSLPGHAGVANYFGRCSTSWGMQAMSRRWISTPTSDTSRTLPMPRRPTLAATGFNRRAPRRNSGLSGSSPATRQRPLAPGDYLMRWCDPRLTHASAGHHHGGHSTFERQSPVGGDRPDDRGRRARGLSVRADRRGVRVRARRKCQYTPLLGLLIEQLWVSGSQFRVAASRSHP